MDCKGVMVCFDFNIRGVRRKTSKHVVHVRMREVIKSSQKCYNYGAWYGETYALSHAFLDLTVSPIFAFTTLDFRNGNR